LHRDSYVTSPSFGSAAGVVFSVCVVVGIRQAQDLAPRAYVITPLHSNAIIQTWALYDGSINYNGALPLSGSTGTYNVEIFSYYHSFSFFGWSANVVASLPYALGSFQGTALGAATPLPFRSSGLGLSLLGKPQGWPSNAGIKIHEMAPEDVAGRQSQGDCPDRSVRSHQADQLGRQSLGLQTGVWIFSTLGQMGARRVHGSVALHYEQQLLVA
jgi:hypothetical protein